MNFDQEERDIVGGAGNEMKGRVISSALILVAMIVVFTPLQAGAGAGVPAPSSGEYSGLKIFSPAPKGVVLDQYNAELGALLSSCSLENIVTAIALPDSINQLNGLSAEEKSMMLPIVTTVDLLPAIAGSGPDKHAYSRKNTDLMFVSSLYDVAFGVLAFDDAIVTPADLKGKRIAVPPHGNSVRVLSEALLGHGWGIRDDVEFVVVPPKDLAAEISEGRIDATTWELMSKTSEGFRPLIPALLEVKGAHWINVTEEVVGSINATSGFVTELTDVIEGEIIGFENSSQTLLSFRQALAAWEATPDTVVSSILTCINKNGSATYTLPRTRQEMSHWPGLTKQLMHRAALEYYGDQLFL